MERRARAAGTAQGGYVLMLVLGAIGLTSVVVVALLGLAITSSRVTVSQRETAREQRAAAGALDSAIGQFADSDPTDPCSALPDPNTAPARISLEPAADGSTTTVEIDCWHEDLTRTLPDSAQPELDSMNPPLGGEGWAQVGTVNRTATGVCSSPAVCTTTFTTTWGSESQVPLTSLHLQFQSSEGENVHYFNRSLRVTLTLDEGGSCTAQVAGGRTNLAAGVYSSFDLFDAAPCRDLLEDEPQSVLDGASIWVDHVYEPAGCPADPNPWVGGYMGCKVVLRVGGVRLLANAAVLEASASSGAGWANASAATSLNGTAAEVTQPNCVGLPSHLRLEDRCRATVPKDTFGISLTGFGSTLPPTLEADEFIDRLGVVIDSGPIATQVRSWISDSVDETQLDITLTVGATECRATSAGFARSVQQIYVDLLDQPGCRDSIQTVQDLVGASVSVSLRADCMHIGSLRAVPGGDGRCWSVRLPDLDRVGLLVTPLPLPAEAIVTLTSCVGDRPVVQADTFFDGGSETPVVAWRHDRFAQRPDGSPPCGPAAAPTP